MSVEAVQAFRGKLSSSAEMQEAVRQAVATGHLGNVVALGRKHAFDFTVDELKHIAEGEELSAFELEMVSAGTPIDCDKSNT